jgi:anti-repressor protein
MTTRKKRRELPKGTWFTMSQAAKIIGWMGRNKLYGFLREQDVLMSNNEPYQKYCDAGYFRLHVSPKYTKRGLFISCFPSVLVSETGISFIQELIEQSSDKVER